MFRVRIGAIWAFAVLFLTGLGRPGFAQVKQFDYAILIVTNGSDPAMRAREKTVADIVKQIRAKYGLTKTKLPILSYHFDNPTERAYCENKLNIHAGDLIFLGVVKEDQLVVKDVLQREPRVQDPDSAAFKAFQRAAIGLGISLNVEGVTPPPPPTGSTIAFKRFVTSNDVGEPCSIFKTTDTAVFFNVFVDNLDEQKDHQHEVKLHIERSDMAVKLDQLPVLGGTFVLHAGVPWQGREVLAEADTAGNGLAIAPVSGQLTLGQLPPGVYKVTIDLDGREVNESSFLIVNDDFQKVSQDRLGILEAFTSNEKGKPMTTFTPTAATGVFCFVTLANLAPDQEHKHTLTVTYLDPTGQIYQKPLGGDFTVVKGANLGGMEFPDDVDPNKANGFVMANGLEKGPFGDWKIQINIDGEVVKELHFTLNQQ